MKIDETLHGKAIKKIISFLCENRYEWSDPLKDNQKAYDDMLSFLNVNFSKCELKNIGSHIEEFDKVVQCIRDQDRNKLDVVDTETMRTIILQQAN